MTKLLKKLISINSISGNEDKIIKFIYDYLKKYSVKVKKINNNLIVEFGSGKKILLIVAHVDTVKPSENWNTDPFKAKEQNNKIYGLGACDNKASVANLIKLIIELKNKKLNGKIIFAFTSEEETSLKGIETVLNNIKELDAAIVTEPTNLFPCRCQKGLAILKIVSKGKSVHTSIPRKKDNAIINAIKEIEKIKKIKFNKKNKLLGYPLISITKINSGISHNIIPDKCEFLLDIRSIPEFDNHKIIELIKKKIESELVVISKRLDPKITRKDSKIVKISEKICNCNSKGFMAYSEMGFLKFPGIVLGPGSLDQAHKVDEFIEINEYKKAKSILKNIILEYLK
jgi:acetylornithine deacetylase